VGLNLGRGPVGIDTSVFIYFIDDEHATFLPLIEPLLQLPLVSGGDR
jgi:hypothetical protein